MSHRPFFTLTLSDIFSPPDTMYFNGRSSGVLNVASIMLGTIPKWVIPNRTMLFWRSANISKRGALTRRIPRYQTWQISDMCTSNATAEGFRRQFAQCRRWGTHTSHCKTFVRVWVGNIPWVLAHGFNRPINATVVEQTSFGLSSCTCGSGSETG